MLDICWISDVTISRNAHVLPENVSAQDGDVCCAVRYPEPTAYAASEDSWSQQYVHDENYQVMVSSDIGKTTPQRHLLLTYFAV